MMTPDRCLIFPSVEYVRNIIVKHSLKQNLPVVIDCSHIYGADFTAAKVTVSSNQITINFSIENFHRVKYDFVVFQVIELLTIEFSRRNQLLFFYNLKPSLVSVFQGVRPKDFNTRIFYDSRDIEQLLLKHALPENSTINSDNWKTSDHKSMHTNNIKLIINNNNNRIYCRCNIVLFDLCVNFKIIWIGKCIDIFLPSIYNRHDIFEYYNIVQS